MRAHEHVRPEASWQQGPTSKFASEEVRLRPPKKIYLKKRLRAACAHAEISAIRAACESVGDFSLTGSAIYSTCEPCPMCLGAIWWARIDAIYFASTRDDAAKIGFDDEFIYKEIPLPYAERSIPFEQLAREIALKPFQECKPYLDHNLSPEKLLHQISF